MNETKNGLVEILISQPQSDRVWDQAVHAIGAKMGWHSADTIAFVEDLIGDDVVFLRTGAVDRSADPRGKAQSWRVRS